MNVKEPTAPRGVQSGVLSLALRGVRGFDQFSLDIRTDDGLPRQRTLVIGPNGTCKTTLLRAVAVGLADRYDAPALTAAPFGGFVQTSLQSASIDVEYCLGGVLPAARSSISIQRERDKELPSRRRAPELPAPFFCGYGANRGASAPGGSSAPKGRAADMTAGLFNLPASFIPVELTLRRLEDFVGTTTSEVIIDGIKRVIGLGTDDRIELQRGGGIKVSGPSVGLDIPFEGWADGYRMTFQWMLDFYGRALESSAITEDGRVHGVLLIDEVDQHLHPSLQARVLPKLCELLPDVQIIATTHSPMVALGAHPSELISLHRTKDGRVVRMPTPDFRLFSAEDVLTDPKMFDTEPFSEDVKAKREEYHRLAAKPKHERTNEEQGELRELAKTLLPDSTVTSEESEVVRSLKAIQETLIQQKASR